MTDVLLSVESISKRFGSVKALDSVSLQLRDGEILGLLGPNGAGKTTLVRSIVGRVRPDEGTITSAQAAGWIPQEIALYPLLTVEENLHTFGRYHGLHGETLTAGVERALLWAGLVERRTSRTATLSGGMKRRLNMAAGVIHRPRIVLMDEPTVGVDPQSREKIYSMIEEMRQESAGIIYGTHYMEEAERLCDRIAVIDSGRIVAAGTRDELLESTIGSRLQARVRSDRELSPEAAAALTAIGATIDRDVAVIPIRDTRTEMERLLRILDRHQVGVTDLSVRPPSLEAVFLRLTGKELRD